MSAQPTNPFAEGLSVRVVAHEVRSRFPDLDARGLADLTSEIWRATRHAVGTGGLVRLANGDPFVLAVVHSVLDTEAIRLAAEHHRRRTQGVVL